MKRTFLERVFSYRLRPVQRHIRRPRLNSQGHSSPPTPHLTHWTPHLAGLQVLPLPLPAHPSVAQVRGSLSWGGPRGAARSGISQPLTTVSALQGSEMI